MVEKAKSSAHLNHIVSSNNEWEVKKDFTTHSLDNSQRLRYYESEDTVNAQKRVHDF